MKISFTALTISALALAGAAVTIGLVRSKRPEGPAAAPTADPQTQRLLEAVERGYATMLAGFAIEGTSDEYDAHDAAVREGVDALKATIAEVEPSIAAPLASACQEFIDVVEAAQVHLMAFAINRKNRGLPDAAEAEAERAARAEFERGARPLLATLQGTTSA